MELTKNEVNSLINQLFSRQNVVVIDTIHQIRNIGNIMLLPSIFELLYSTDNQDIKNEIFLLLNDIKDEKAVPLIVDVIQNQQFKKELLALVGACWQNGLDFSKFINVFVDLLINEDFLIAFEAFTVIENMTGSFSSETANFNISKLKSYLSDTQENKKMLFVEIINQLQNSVVD